MCHFITATLSKATDIDAVAALFEQFKLGFKVIHNPHLASQLPAGDHYISTTRNHCDCGTVLGSSSQLGGGKTPSSRGDLRKLRKQGWSEAKIKRWLQEKELTRENAEIKAQHITELEISQATHWVNFLTSVLKLGRTKQIGLLLHWYKGGLTNERIKLKNIVIMPISNLMPDYLLQIEEDVLYRFVHK